MDKVKVPIHSNKVLVKASAVAMLFAVIIFITIVLPAEYHRDPTGIGQMFGLMTLTKSLNDNQQSSEGSQKENIETLRQSHTVEVSIPANSGVEYKFTMKKYSNIEYKWKTNGGASLYFDFHGEPRGDTTGYFESYTIATTNEVSGSMTVPFEGVHGWYWKNTSNKNILVTLQTKGNYEVVGLIH